MNDAPSTKIAVNTVLVSGPLGAGTPGAPGLPGIAAGASRPSVLSLAIREKAALYAAYMPYLKNGGIFVPTNKPYQLGDQVYLILTLLDDPTKIPVAGKVVWIGPTGGSKTQGIGVHFPADESGQIARKRIEDALGSALKSLRPTHTI
jgi:type IV pilus assembly protein PilZ